MTDLVTFAGDEQVWLGKQAMASPHWGWVPGMLTLDGVRVLEGWWDCFRGIQEFTRSGEDGEVHGSYKNHIPDLSDAATLGAIEHALLPEMYGCEVSVCFYYRSWWIVLHNDSGTHIGLTNNPKTKAEALVAALHEKQR